ncbi:MAG TPA: c-type cytochrome biogenesis protein CcmI [Caulobacteraceae bacterium]
MIVFWVAAAILAAGAAGLMLYRAARGDRVARAADPKIDLYRRALGEIDELAERDLLAPDEQRSVRAEAARRLIGASDRAAPPIHASGKAVVPLTAGAAVAIAAVAIYSQIGSPSLPDQPFAARLATWKANPEAAPPAAMAAMLNVVANQRPDDATPLRKLAALDLGLGDADGAAHALRRALMIEPADANLAAMLGEVKVMQNNGSLTPDARALFERAVGDSPGQPAARYYLAKAKIGDGDVAGGLADWRALLATLQPSDPRAAVLGAEIAEVERTGKLASPSTQQAGPPPAELNAAIQGMVDGLAARLAAQPDDADGWVRLVRAYAVLGDTGKRDAALSQARARYSGQPAELTALAAAAKTAPMTGNGG